MSRMRLWISVTIAGCITIVGMTPQKGFSQDRPQRVEQRRVERRSGAPQQALPPVQDQQTTPAVQERIEAQPTAQPPAQRPAPTYRAKAILGTKVSLQSGLAIGTVDDIIFDDNGYVDYLVVQNEGKFVPVPWQAAQFNFTQHTAVVDIPQERFREVPTFTLQHAPNFYDTTYRQRIYSYYGLKPGQERRMERREGIRRR